jgi:hypothetical protein
MSEAANRPLTTKGPSTIADFPLAQFGLDLSKPIGQRDIDDCEAKIRFNAHAQGDDPSGSDVLRACDALRAAATWHNDALRAAAAEDVYLRPKAPPIA